MALELIFLKITFWKVCHASEYSVILYHFLQNFWLCKPVENFLCIVHIRYGYLKHATRSEECSALWIIFVRHVFRKLSPKRKTTPPFGQNGGGVYYTLASLAPTSKGTKRFTFKNTMYYGNSRSFSPVFCFAIAGGNKKSALWISKGKVDSKICLFS